MDFPFFETQVRVHLTRATDLNSPGLARPFREMLSNRKILCWPLRVPCQNLAILSGPLSFFLALMLPEPYPLLHPGFAFGFRVLLAVPGVFREDSFFFGLVFALCFKIRGYYCSGLLIIFFCFSLLGSFLAFGSLALGSAFLEVPLGGNSLTSSPVLLFFPLLDLDDLFTGHLVFVHDFVLLFA